MREVCGKGGGGCIRSGEREQMVREENRELFSLLGAGSLFAQLRARVELLDAARVCFGFCGCSGLFFFFFLIGSLGAVPVQEYGNEEVYG